MKRWILLSLIFSICILTIPAWAERSISSDLEAENLIQVFFDTDKSDIKPEFNENLDLIAKKIISEELQLVIVGNADTRGSQDYNFQLGDKRAQAVATALLKRGVSSDQILAVSFGEQKPAYVNKSEVQLDQSRRVDVLSVRPKKIRFYHKNRITLFGGIGPQGVDKKILSDTSAEVTSATNPVFGVGYSRSFSPEWSVGGAIFTNKSMFINVGYDF